MERTVTVKTETITALVYSMNEVIEIMKNQAGVPTATAVWSADFSTLSLDSDVVEQHQE